MAVGTFSVFYYGYNIDANNKFFNFDEGGGELTAELTEGTYTLTEILVNLKTALDAVGTDTYSVTVDRSNRKITIASTGTFSILLGTGTQKGTSPYVLLGFTGTSDTASASSHTSSSASGSSFEPQFYIQDFTDDNDYQEKIDSKVNESASGELEVINFGTRKFFEMSFKFITDLPGDGKVIKNNPNGEADARAFLQDATNKNRIEFMIDIDNRNTFKTLVLESTPTSKQGTAYKLVEQVQKGLPGYYEINRLKFRSFD